MSENENNILVEDREIEKLELTPETADTTGITGEAPNSNCNRWAAYLCAYVYDLAKGTSELDSSIKAKIDENWEQKKTFDDGSGAYAVLFTAKRKEEGQKTCPPTLAFRGTVFDDFRGLKFLVGIEFSDIEVDTGEVTLQNVPLLGKVNLTLDIQATVKQFSFNYLIDPNAAQKVQSYPTYEAAEGVAVTKETSGEKLLLNEHVSGDYMSSGDEQRRLSYKGSLRLKAYWGNEGDWSNNVSQGVGAVGKQFDSVKQWAVEAAAMVKEDGRLRITGHSQGGAQAAVSAVEAVGAGVDITTITFNAAGVHPNTINRQKHVNVSNRTIEDEILTSLQNRSTELNVPPFTNTIIQIARNYSNDQNIMPPAMGGKNDFANSYDGGNRTLNLFPLSTGYLATLHNATRSASTTKLFLEQFLTCCGTLIQSHIMQNELNGMSLDFSIIKAQLEAELAALSGIITTSVHYHGMNVVIDTMERNKE